MFKEVNTKTNLPAQIDLCATSGAQYDFQFIAKGICEHDISLPADEGVVEPDQPHEVSGR
jgi:hypothetical protein